MYSDKKNILQLVALMLEYGIRHVVLSPGSRNAPLIHTFTSHADFKCYTVVDERSAGFFALGLSQRLQQPVAVCCTSGTALLNYGPAIAEAFYQEVPLLVISADRPAAWIGQADGQTIPQNGIFDTIVKKSVQLPEISNKTEEWYCNRLINEALICLTQNGCTPVHINIPLSEPLYQFTEKELPAVRRISLHIPNQQIGIKQFAERWNSHAKRMIVVGQLPPGHGLDDIIASLAEQQHTVVVAEQISNLRVPQAIGNFDALISSFPEDELVSFAPELVITLGGHITSKQLKLFLRTPFCLKEQWDIRVDGRVQDTFQSLTDVIPMLAEDFLVQLSEAIQSSSENDNFSQKWHQRSEQVATAINQYLKTIPFSDMSVVRAFTTALPAHTTLHLSNSSPIRYAQFFNIDPTIQLFSNRGTNGIDGVVSTAVGHAVENDQLTFLLVGDLSFFYDINGLWNRHVSPNLRILLINNGGGNMFHLINCPGKSTALENYIACQHSETTKERAIAFGLHYLSASGLEELHQHLPIFCDASLHKPMVLEVFTQTETNSFVFKSLYNHLKNR